MANRLSDYYNGYYKKVLGRVENLDYGEDFPESTGDSHYSKCAEAIEGIIGETQDPADLRVLDIGVGTGSMMHWLRHKGITPSGVDISERLVTHLKEKGFDVMLHDMNETPLPVPDRLYDVIIAMDVIEHVICPLFFMEQVRNVCAPGGHVILSTANSRTFKSLYTLAAGGRFPWTCPERDGWDCGHLHYFTSRDIVDLGRRYGFEPFAVEGVSPIRPGTRGLLKKMALAALPRGFRREFFSGTIMVHFIKNS